MLPGVFNGVQSAQQLVSLHSMATSSWANWFDSIGKSLNHTISEDDLTFGDHIYVYRAMMTFSHHGIYCGKWKDLRGAILNQINDLDKKQNIDFYKRLKQSYSLFIDQKDDKKENQPHKINSDSPKSMIVSSTSSNLLSNPSQSISDILDSVKNKKQILLSICDTFKPNDGIVIHLSGTAETGPLIQPCSLYSFINEGVGSFKYINTLKRARYNCNMFSFYIKRSGSCSNEKMLTNRNITIKRAINALGWDEYSVTGFNCESFCVYCKIEKPISYQAETILSINDFIEGTGRITKKCADFIGEQFNDVQDTKQCE